MFQWKLRCVQRRDVIFNSDCANEERDTRIPTRLNSNQPATANGDLHLNTNIDSARLIPDWIIKSRRKYLLENFDLYSALYVRNRMGYLNMKNTRRLARSPLALEVKTSVVTYEKGGIELPAPPHPINIPSKYSTPFLHSGNRNSRGRDL